MRQYVCDDCEQTFSEDSGKEVAYGPPGPTGVIADRGKLHLCDDCWPGESGILAKLMEMVS